MSFRQVSETQFNRMLHRRMFFVHVFLGFAALVIVARLLELQFLRGKQYLAAAQSQHYGGVVLSARRGEILSRNSKTTDTSILATNTTLDLVYVDPVVVDDPGLIADTLANVLITDQIHAQCSQGHESCSQELMEYYADAYDPLNVLKKINTGSLLEPLPASFVPTPVAKDITEVRRLFARSIESRISEKRVTFVPLVYGATKVQMKTVKDFGFSGIFVNEKAKLISADPEAVNQGKIPEIARALTPALQLDTSVLARFLRSRPLRYVSIMHRLPPELSARIRDLQLQSANLTAQKRRGMPLGTADQVRDPLRAIALLPENWRYYPDSTLASNVIGFLNPNQEAQYGVERTFDPVLRGQQGLIATVSDPSGGQILTSDQTIVNSRDGDTVVLTIDRDIQKEIEKIMDRTVKSFGADSGQAIVMEPDTGRILAMVNAPVFDSNNYSNVYQREPMILDSGKQGQIVVEIYNPVTNGFVLKAYLRDVFTSEGRALLSPETQKKLTEIEDLYDLKDVVRYYHYLGENNRIEIFPTDRPEIWLKFKNGIGVGAYLNRTVQNVYEPGSVFKPITMAIAIDQGEVTPDDIYNDDENVKVDEFTVKNALLINYGKVTMTNCLEFSINTCMTSVGRKLGKKLFFREIERFGFGKITGIELEDELPGVILPWKDWSNALLATASFGQGISTTPLQVITAYTALANGGKLMRPMIIDSVIHSDGTSEKYEPHVVDQVLTPEASQTITAMLVSSVAKGYAKSAHVKGHRIAGKTGTSQMAGPGGKYETGTGSVVTSFMGYAPIAHPKFVVLVKFDRPRAKGLELGVQSAAPVFKEIATFLFRYYGIPPDEK